MTSTKTSYNLVKGRISVCWVRLLVKNFEESDRLFTYHLICRIKAGVCNFHDSMLFMGGLLATDDWGVSGKREVNSWVRDQVGLKFGQIDIQRS